MKSSESKSAADISVDGVVRAKKTSTETFFAGDGSMYSTPTILTDQSVARKIILCLLV